jgi:hypothetical protein
MFSHLFGMRLAAIVAASAAPGRMAFSLGANLIAAFVVAIGLQGNFASSSAAFDSSSATTRANGLLTLTHCRRTYHCEWSTREYGTRPDKKVWRCHVCP